MKLSKKSLRLLILVAILIVAVIVTLIVKGYEEKQEKIKSGSGVALTIDEEDVTALSWESDDSTFAFHKDGDSWKYDEDDAFPVSSDKISSLLSQFMSLETAFEIDDVTDYAQYGLKKPGLTIHITTDEKTYDISVGDLSTMDNERYISIDDGKVYLVDQDPMEDYNLALSDLIQNDSIPSITDIDSMSISGPENYTIEKTDDEYLAGARIVDETNLANYISTLTGLSLTDYKTYNAGDSDLKECGLDEPDLTVSVESGDDSFTVSASKADDSYFVRVGDSKIIYNIDEDTYNALIKASYDDLRSTKVVGADFNDISKAVIELDGETYEFIQKEDEDEKGNDIADLKDSLTALTADSFTDKNDSTKVEISLTLSIENEKTDKTTITFYRYDGEHCLAVIDGVATSLVPRDQVVALIEAVNADVL